jgi:hypothetical protein
MTPLTQAIIIIIFIFIFIFILSYYILHYLLLPILGTKARAFGSGIPIKPSTLLGWLGFGYINPAEADLDLSLLLLPLTLESTLLYQARCFPLSEE